MFQQRNHLIYYISNFQTSEHREHKMRKCGGSQVTKAWRKQINVRDDRAQGHVDMEYKRHAEYEKNVVHIMCGDTKSLIVREM